MRIYLLILIIVIFGVFGYEIKRKYLEQKNTLIFLKSFIEFLRINMSVYKNNIQEIIINYKIMQNNKNAKYVNYFLKNNKIDEENIKNICDKLIEKDFKIMLELYFGHLGSESVESESKKTENILSVLNEYIIKSNEDVKNKGDLYFKILLVCGIVLVILLWWIMGVSILFKIAAVGILTIVISQLFQHQGKGDLATLSSLAGLVIVLAMVLSMVSDLFSSIKALFEF